MIKAPRYPDIIDKPSNRLLHAASRFTGVLNTAYHTPTSYSQKHLRRNSAPAQEQYCYDRLLSTTVGPNMTLRKIQKETIRRQKFLQEKKRQAEMEEAKRRERVLEERHLQRLEQAKLIRYRVHTQNQVQATGHSRTKRAYSERAFPVKTVQSTKAESIFEKAENSREIVTYLQQAQLSETDEHHVLLTRDSFTSSQRDPATERKQNNDVGNVHEYESECSHFGIEPPSNVSESMTNSCLTLYRNIAEFETRGSDKKSVQSEPPLRPRLLQVAQDREEDELMRNLANLNEKLNALRLKKSINFKNCQDEGSGSQIENSVIPDRSNYNKALKENPGELLLPDIRQPSKQWLVPKLARTPTARCRRNRAR